MSNSTDSISSPTAPAAASSGFSLYLLGCALVAALGGLLFGFDTAVISGTTDWLKAGFVKDITAQLAPRVTLEFMLGFTVASALIGTMLGSIAVGKPADIFGRREHAVRPGRLLLHLRRRLRVWPGTGGRSCCFVFLGGLAVGGASVVSPMYIAEISPAALPRAGWWPITQFNVDARHSAGLPVQLRDRQFAAWARHECRWMFGVMAVPVGGVLLPAVPHAAEPALAGGAAPDGRGPRRCCERCGTDTGHVDDEIRDIQASLDLEHHTLREPFFCRKYLKPILLAVAIAAFNQLSGINALIYYTPDIFKMAGVSDQCTPGCNR